MYRVAFYWFVFALAIRIAYFAEQAVGPMSFMFYQPVLDEAEAMLTAQRLLSGEGFPAEPLWKAPLYPILLAGIGLVTGTGDIWFWAIRLFQHLAGAGLVVIVFLAARRLCGPWETGARGENDKWWHKRSPAFYAANLAALLLALHGPLVRLEHRLILDFWAVFFQSWMLERLLAAYLTPAAKNNPFGSRRALYALQAGMLGAASWLTRPTLTPALPFLALFLVWRLLRVKRFKTAFITAGFFLGPILIAMGGFAAHNYIRGGEALFLPWQGGYSFYYANNSEANGRYYLQSEFAALDDAIEANPARTLAINGYLRAQQAAGVPLEQATAGGPPAGGPARSAVNDYWFTLAKDEIKADPGRWLYLMLQKGVYLIQSREVFNFEEYGVHRKNSRVLMFLFSDFRFQFLALILGIPWLFFLPYSRRSAVWLILLYSVLLGGAIGLYFTSGRMRMPLVFATALLAATGAAGHHQWNYRVKPSEYRKSFRYAAYFFCILFAIVFQSINWWGVKTERMHYAEYAKLSGMAFKAGDVEAAIKYADLLYEEAPDYPQAPQLLGQALHALGKFEGARKEYLKSIKRLPTDARAPYNLGLIEYYERGEAEAALEAFREARRRDPRYERAAALECLTHLRLGDKEAAVQAVGPWLRVPPARSSEELLIARIALAKAHDRPHNPADEAALAALGQPSLEKLALDLQLVGVE